MRTVYQTLDGEIFNDPCDAELYERAINMSVQMYDYYGNLTTNTFYAHTVFLADESAAELFLKMLENNPEEIDYDPTADIGIRIGDKGWFQFVNPYYYAPLSPDASKIAAQRKID